MSKSFVRPPVEDRMLNEDGYLSEAWKHWFLDTWQSMDELANEAGIQVPNLTEAQRDGTASVEALIDTTQIQPGFICFVPDDASANNRIYMWDGSNWLYLNATL